MDIDITGPQGYTATVNINLFTVNTQF
jgi:hypothetical protein